MERLKWLATATRGAEIPDWMFESSDDRIIMLGWDHGIRTTSAEALAEIERLRERVTDLLSSNNAFEQRARDARALAKKNNDALTEIEPRWRDLESAMDTLTRPRPISEYHEDMGDVLWWKLPITEPPYVGSPNDVGFQVEVHVRLYGDHESGAPTSADSKDHFVGGWPGYHTHFTPLPKIKEIAHEATQV